MGRVVPKSLVQQDIRNGAQRHGRPRMPTIGGLDGVHRGGAMVLMARGSVAFVETDVSLLLSLIWAPERGIATLACGRYGPFEASSVGRTGPKVNVPKRYPRAACDATSFA